MTKSEPLKMVAPVEVQFINRESLIMALVNVKAGVLGFMTIASIGLITLPARADNEVIVEQEATQSTAVIGDGNTAATGNQQIAEIMQRSRSSRGVRDAGNGAGVRQRVDQATGVSGYGNAVGTDNQQTTRIIQIKKPVHPVIYPRY
jgi:hypothetical protein